MALKTAGELDADGTPTTGREDQRFTAKLRALGPEALVRFAAAVSAGALDLQGLNLAVTDMSKRQARELLDGLRPDVEPISIGLDALGEVDLSTLTSSVPDRGPYLDGLVAERGLMLLAGRGGVGKTWIALRACMDAVSAGGAVYMDLDGNGPERLYGRLRLLGLSDAEIRTRAVNVVDPAAIAARNRAGTWETVQAILKGLEAAPPSLLVLDSFAKLIAAMGGSENDAADCNRILGLVEYLRTVTAVIVIDHVGHEATARPRGAAAKIDTPDSVVMLRAVESPPDDDLIAAADLVAVKDRNGALRAHLATAADFGLGMPLGRVDVRHGHGARAPHTVTVTSARDAAASASSLAAAENALGLDPDSRRATELARVVEESGHEGVSATELVEVLTGMGDGLALPRQQAREWVHDCVARWVASRWVDEVARGRGRRVVWVLADPNPTYPPLQMFTPIDPADLPRNGGPVPPGPDGDQ
ncbi:AAA family ATPase [Gordonia sputi]|uniref:AAA family ATPase n=1 Tax=Gordonia sputi TaxID=36823 RepID=UPI0020440CD9|nr:AAA family ATPase [Gordonia sputi]MCM3897106.1 AAA family ATPase [Gordonia sputi]